MVPLTEFLKKDQLWRWAEKQNVAFENLKTVTLSEHVLKQPNFDVPFEVHTDASAKAVAGLLVHGHLIAFERWKLKKAEHKYSAHEKEMLAVVHCLQMWRVYLLGTNFVVKTDNVANSLQLKRKYR